MTRALALLAALLALVVACQRVPACVPGQALACSCIDGRPGGQSCLADGTYAPCVCVARDPTPTPVAMPSPPRLDAPPVDPFPVAAPIVPAPDAAVARAERPPSAHRPARTLAAARPRAPAATPAADAAAVARPRRDCGHIMHACCMTGELCAPGLQCINTTCEPIL